MIIRTSTSTSTYMTYLGTSLLGTGTLHVCTVRSIPQHRIIPGQGYIMSM